MNRITIEKMKGIGCVNGITEPAFSYKSLWKWRDQKPFFKTGCLTSEFIQS